MYPAVLFTCTKLISLRPNEKARPYQAALYNPQKFWVGTQPLCSPCQPLTCALSSQAQDWTGALAGHLSIRYYI